MLAALATPLVAGENLPPQLDARGQEAYLAFRQAGGHRAFAIAPGGAWAWQGDEASADAASDAALATCRHYSDQTCVLYEVDQRKVFDSARWPQLWGPYADAASARQRPMGSARGERLPDITWKNADGKTTRLSDLRGQVVILHFWGSWCPPCRRELPELQTFARQLTREKGIRLVLLPAREDFASARRFTDSQHLDLPLADPAARGRQFDQLTLADGSLLPDRQLSPVFPTTLVIDRHGLVLLRHPGPITDWPSYLPFLKDAASKSGR